jgi:UDP-N-acetylmuramate dehydrogenase
VFKNPREDIRSGELIDLAGLKGTRFGDAQVSEKHANFIVNLGNAKCKDVLNLIDFVQNKIYSLYGISLETEIKVVGDLNEK